MLINEETFENDYFIPALYIYAIITRKCDSSDATSFLENTLCTYEIDIGQGRHETRRAYDLYKFSRNNQTTSTELSPFLDVADWPKDDRDLDSILKEVKEMLKAAWSLAEDERRKVIKRLYKKWHSDKNHGNEEVAKRVFQFIQQTVLRMENGQDIDTEDAKSYDPHPGSYFYSQFRTWDRDARHDAGRTKRRGKRGQSSGH